MSSTLSVDSLTRALAECEAEAVHTPGAVQPFGALFVVDPDLTIRHCGGLVAELTGLAARQAVGRNLAEFLPADLAAATRTALAEAERLPGQLVLVGDWPLPDGEGAATVKVHTHAGRRFVEALLWSDGVETREVWLLQPRPDELLARWTDNLAKVVPPEQFFTQLADDLQKLSGYDRVLIYRFDDDGHGEVVAEGRGPHLTDSFLHHRFPASDIPTRSRELYVRNPYRIVADVLAEPRPLVPACDPASGEPVDLSHAVLRAVPVVHRQYLANMRVRASFVVPVLDHHRLWGLIACHHYSPRLPGRALRRLAEIAADLLAARIGYVTAQARCRLQAQAQQVLTNLERAADSAATVWSAVVAPEVGLAELLEAPGLAVVGPDGVFATGRVPPEPRLRELAEWLDGRMRSGAAVLATPALGQLSPALANLRDTAAGLLACPIGDPPRPHWLLAFRPQQPAELSRPPATDPGPHADPESLPPLTPERSFAQWRQRVRGVARSWAPVLVEVVEATIRPALLRLALAAARRRTERAEEQLRLLATAIENIRDLVLITDADCEPPGPRIVYANPAAEAITGYTPQELIGQSPRLLQGPETDRATLDRIRTALLRGEPVQAELINYHKSGRPYWIELNITPVRDASGRVTHFAAVQRDTTERKRLEAALAEASNLHRMLTESMQDVIALIGPDARLLYVSPSVTRLTGFTPEEMLAEPDSRTFAHPDDQARLRANLEANLAGQFRPLEWRCRRKDGSYVWVETVTTPVRDPTGQITAVICCTREIEDRKRTEQELAQVRKLEAVGQLAGGIAHDFNNLLTVVSGCAELLLADLPPNAPQRALVEDIAEAGRRGAVLTGQLLTFARKHVREERVIDVDDHIRRLSGLLRRLIGEDILVVLDLGSEGGSVLIDPRELDQVLLNLAVNARDAMPHGGRLTVRTDRHDFGPADPSPHPEARPGSYVCVCVADTGHGIPAEVREHLFEPFFTTKPEGKGTGLGLATVHGIVRAAGGFITVESEPGQGATFRIFLPRVEAAPPPSTTTSTAETIRLREPAGTGVTVLLVEDDPGVRGFVQAVLEPAGYRVLTAETGFEAIQVCEAATEPPDLVITDVVLPGLSGPDLVTHLTRRQKNLGVIFTSGYTADKLPPLESLDATVLFLPKPFDVATLLRTVQKVLARRPVQ